MKMFAQCPIFTYLLRTTVKDKGNKKNKTGHQKKEATQKPKKITGSDTGYPIE